MLPQTGQAADSLATSTSSQATVEPHLGQMSFIAKRLSGIDGCGTDFSKHAKVMREFCPDFNPDLAHLANHVNYVFELAIEKARAIRRVLLSCALKMRPC